MINAVFEVCIEQLRAVQNSESEAIQAAAKLVADAIAGENGFFLFGSGHSAFIARDAYWRAGGLAPALPIPDPLAGDAERLQGIATILLAHYNLQPGGVMIVISNSGINHLPVEIAFQAKASGLSVVAITSRQHSGQVPARHPSEKKLMDIADIIIDTHGAPGDAALKLPGSTLRLAPTSTIVGSAILQAVTAQAAALLLERGIEPPVIVSSNLPHGDASNRKLALRYRTKLVRYEVPTVDITPREWR